MGGREVGLTHKITGLPPVSHDEETAGRQLRCIFLFNRESPMATYYRIEDGYNSGNDRDEVWDTIKQVVDAIQNNTQRIIDEVFRLEPDADRELIEEVAGCYRKPVQDLTIKVVEGEDGRWIGQSASGGKPGRDAKESCRRAVCRLVLEDMHRRKMEVNIIVG